MSSSAPSTSVAPGRAKPPSTRRQIVLLTLGAIALYVGIRQLPTGTNLSHLDFRVSGGNSIEFCDPANPQFIPVVSVRSPVTMAVAVSGAGAVRGQVASVVLNLTTSTGKPIAPQDLMVAHTEKLHLLVFDPELLDYQHIHPTPGKKPGDWEFTFTPHRTGLYRIFGDFTPAATARSLYASADLTVGGMPPTGDRRVLPAARTGASAVEYTEGDLIFRLKAASLPLKARSMSEFDFQVRSKDGAPAKLEPVMDAYAHLVAIDLQRSGFAHLHPAQLVDPRSPGTAYSQLNFKIAIPRAGAYVVWAQVRVNGQDRYAPFRFDVVEP